MPVSQIYGVMAGYGVKIRALKQDDIDTFEVELSDTNPNDCVAIDGEDLASCLAAVVNIKTKTVIFGDSDGDGTPIANSEEFARAVCTIIASIIPVEID